MLIYAEAGLCDNEQSAAVVAKLEKEAAQHWDRFYRNNADKFYKDRHYFDREFPDLLNGPQVLLEVSRRMVLECMPCTSGHAKAMIHMHTWAGTQVGCGAGNTVFPVLELNPEVHAYCCDFAPRAVELVKAHPSYASGAENSLHVFFGACNQVLCCCLGYRTGQGFRR